ncbi:helix-turn-helix domain-containing protein [Nocardiopsis chromatogenes]|uniref:helix-turn-helix domain-containing protein n=1 Tax=Nocardiopsis chromatogenes TaxID=280239 RepID=UPI000345E8D2|nr:helix-turn-helix domain-containing protein [Nocardiopsis chromatogenes]
MTTGREQRSGQSELDEVVENVARVHQELEERREREGALNGLIDTVRELAEQQTRTDLERMLTRRMRLLLGLDAAFIGVQSADGARVVHAPDGHVSTMLNMGMATPAGVGLGSWAVQANAPAWTADYLADDRFEHDEVIDDVMLSEGLRGLIAVPLARDPASSTTLYAGARSVRSFTPEEVSLASTLGQVAGALLRRYTAMEEAETARGELQRRLERAEARTREGLPSLLDRLLSAVLGGAELSALAAEIAERLAAAVCVRSADGRELARAGTPEHGWPDPEEVRRAAPWTRPTGAPVAVDRRTWAAPIRAGADDFGLLLAVFEEPGGADAGERVRAAAKALSVTALLRVHGPISEAQIRDELLSQLLTESTATDPQAARRREQRARHLGIELAEPHVAVAAECGPGEPSATALSWADAYVRRRGGLRTVQGERLALLLPGDDPGAAAAEVAAELGRVCGRPVSAGGAGPASGIEQVRRAHEEALRTLEALGALGREGAAACARDLGFFGALLSDRRGVGEFVDAELGPLLAYDRQHCTELAATLQAYLATGGSPTHAARRLHVHPNTVSRRLERIGDLLGPDWQDPERAMELHLALRLTRLRDLVGAPG